MPQEQEYNSSSKQPQVYESLHLLRNQRASSRTRRWNLASEDDRWRGRECHGKKERKDLETLPRKTTETCKYNWWGVAINCARKMTKDHSLLPMLRDRYLWTLNSPLSLHQTCQNMSQIAAVETVNEVSTPIIWAAIRRGRKQIKGACWGVCVCMCCNGFQTRETPSPASPSFPSALLRHLADSSAT
jgi:hypothetical protein